MQNQAVVLMPYFRTRSDLFEKSLQSFLKQDYQNKKLVIYVDNVLSEEKDLKNILEKYVSKDIVIIGGKEHVGVAKARNNLLSYVKENQNDNDIIFQLDSDDYYTSDNAISKVIKNMKENAVDVAILNFEYGFYDGKTEDEGLKATELETNFIVEKYKEAKYFEPREDLEKLTSLGWTKVYTAKLFKKLPFIAEDGKYEDFIYMALFCVDNIKVVGDDTKCIMFNKYSSSITSNRTEKDCESVVKRLSEFKQFYNELAKNLSSEKKIIYKHCMKNFIDVKLRQYESIFKNYDNEHNTKLFNYYMNYRKNNVNNIESEEHYI